MSSLAKCKNDAAGAFKKKKKKLKPNVCLTSEEKNPEEKIKSEEKDKIPKFFILEFTLKIFLTYLYL